MEEKKDNGIMLKRMKTSTIAKYHKTHPRGKKTKKKGLPMGIQLPPGYELVKVHDNASEGRIYGRDYYIRYGKRHHHGKYFYDHVVVHEHIPCKPKKANTMMYDYYKRNPKAYMTPNVTIHGDKWAVKAMAKAFRNKKMVVRAKQLPKKKWESYLPYVLEHFNKVPHVYKTSEATVVRQRRRVDQATKQHPYPVVAKKERELLMGIIEFRSKATYSEKLHVKEFTKDEKCILKRLVAKKMISVGDNGRIVIEDGHSWRDRRSLKVPTEQFDRQFRIFWDGNTWMPKWMYRKYQKSTDKKVTHD